MSPSSHANRPPHTADLDGLCDALRHTADQLRAEQPLLDESKLGAAMMILHQATSAFTKALPEAHLANKRDYLDLRGPWLEAWANDTAETEAMARRELGPDMPAAPADERDVTLWRLRLLALIIARQGADRTREALARINESMLAHTELGITLTVDREASEALRKWGRFDVETFIGGWKSIDGDLLKRAARIVGVNAPKRWTRMRQEDFHRRARRFLRNTMI